MALIACRASTDDDQKTWRFDLVEQLHEFCFCGDNDCERYSCDAFLYLDTGNLPGENPGQPTKLVLSGQPTAPLARGDRIEFHFEGELDPAIDPGLAGQRGWKVKITGIRIEYCDVCYTEFGLADVIYLRGDLADLEFVADPRDERDTYISVQLDP
ncbi:MAG: hypothetical protein R6X25_09920 [Candidatus Krumholzibacteriia bacterium]